MISVLYVDDEPGLLEIGKLFLEATGSITVEKCLSGREALIRLEERSFDAVVSDYQMPDRDGIELLTIVRGMHPEIPFIIFTGKSREEIAIMALNLGADYYLQKGGDPKAQFAELKDFILKAVDRRRNEQALQESEERYRRLLAHSFDAVIVQSEGKIVFLNEGAARLLGVNDTAGILGRPMIDFIHPDYLDIVKKRIEKLDIEGVVPLIEEKFIRTDGTEIDVEVMASAFVYQGKPAAQVIIRDISARKRSEQQLKKERKRLFSIMDTLPAFVYLQAPDYTVSFSNRRFRELFGDPDGRKCYEILRKRTDPCEHCKTIGVFSSRSTDFWVWKSDECGTFLLYDTFLPGIEGCIEGVDHVLVVGVEITGFPQLEEAFLAEHG